MKRFKILDVLVLRADTNSRILVYSPVLTKNIILPYPEFNSDCIVVVANPIDLRIEDNGEVVGSYSCMENRRTCYFIKPYTKDALRYWQTLKEEDDDWIPFFPEQKEINYFEGDSTMSFYKDISFNKDWTPISHALYVNRENAANVDNIDYLDLDIDKYQIIDVEEYEFNSLFEDVEYDVYAHESFGEIEEDECQDEIWACAKLLQKEMYYIVDVVTLKDGNFFMQHTKEVIGWNVDDALSLALESVAQSENRNLNQFDIGYCKIYHNGELVLTYEISKD